MMRCAALLLFLLQACAAPPVAGPFWSASGIADQELLVTLRQDRPERIAALTQALATEYGLALVADWPLRVLDLHCLVVRTQGNADVAGLSRRLANDARVDAVQPMNRFAVLANAGDPLTDLQHGLDEANVRRAHAFATGRGVRIGLIDTAVDTNHVDLRTRVEVLQDFTGPAAAGATGDSNAVMVAPPRPAPERHGTALAGILAAERGNGHGIIGVAPEAQVLGLRACWQVPGGVDRGVCNSFTLARAVHFALLARPGVLNLSLQGPDDPLLARLLLEAIAYGTTVVAAYDARSPGRFPASLPGVIAVAEPAAVGLNPPAGLLRAHGVEILSTAPGGGYAYVTGSSIAAAHVAGAAALLLEIAPQAGPGRIASLLRATARPGTGSNGASLLDACAATVALMAEMQGKQDQMVACGVARASDAVR